MLDASIVLRSLNNACVWLDASETQSLNTFRITVANHATSRTCEAIPRPTEPSNFNQMHELRLFRASIQLSRLGRIAFLGQVTWQTRAWDSLQPISLLQPVGFKHDSQAMIRHF